MRSRVEERVTGEVVAEAGRGGTGQRSAGGQDLSRWREEGLGHARGRCADDAGADDNRVLGRDVQAATRARQGGHS